MCTWVLRELINTMKMKKGIHEQSTLRKHIPVGEILLDSGDVEVCTNAEIQVTETGRPGMPREVWLNLEAMLCQPGLSHNTGSFSDATFLLYMFREKSPSSRSLSYLLIMLGGHWGDVGGRGRGRTQSERSFWDGRQKSEGKALWIVNMLCYPLR